MGSERDRRHGDESPRAKPHAPVHVESLSGLHLAVGQSVIVEMVGTPGDYRATKLTSAGVSFGTKG